MTRAPVLSLFTMTLSIAMLVALTTSTVAPAARAATSVDAGTYQETSSAVTYSGSWSTLQSSSSSGGAIRYSGGSEASADLTFTGPSITWHTWRSPSGGIVEVYIDGVHRASVDNYASTTQYGVRGFTATDISAGEHTISIRGTGTANAASSGTITHFDSFVVGTDRSSAPTATTQFRYKSCPTATVRVWTAAQLTAALGAARPGTVIALAPGTYRGGFELAVSGTASEPIWICGPRDAVVQGLSVSEGTALRLNGTDHVHVAGFTVSTALQGVLVKFSTYVTVTDLVVKDVGYEGIHLYAFTTDSTVMYNTIGRTGAHDVAFGEGVYIGTSQRRWDVVTAGLPDRSDRNTVARNTIIDAGAESIEAKEGTTGGLIEGNTIKGHRTGSRAIGWILVTGNDWVVTGNTGTDAVEHGYASMIWEDWGYRNKFYTNNGVVGADGYGVWVHNKSRDVTVSCDNNPTGATAGITNVFCTP